MFLSSRSRTWTFFDAGPANSFYFPNVLCLTVETASMVCPAEKVDNIIALVRSYVYAGKDCALPLRVAGRPG